MASFIPNVTDIFPEPALYRPDFSYLDTMLRRRQSMYEQGFAELSNKYKHISRSVTNGANAKVRDEFINQAQSNLKNLSSMDLSQQQNVQTAGKVFDSFSSNTNVLGDMALTSHWDQQETIADSLRLKDGGKEYSDDNINYVRMQRQAFAQDKADSWNSYYSSKRAYTPYYNYSKDVMEAMKEFKSSSSKVTTPKNGYLITEENNSIDSEEVKMYLSNVLNDKAKQQMSIEGVVKYSNNPTIFENYSKGLGKTEKYITDKISEAEGKLLGSKDPAQKQQLQAGLTMLKDKLEDITLEKNNLSNPEYIAKNKEAIAANLYYSDKIQDLSKAFARKNINYEMKADDVYLTRLREAGLNRRHKETIGENRLLKQVDLGMLTFDTRGNIVKIQDQSFLTPTGETKTGLTYGDFLQQKESVVAAKANASDNLKKFYYESNPQFRQQGVDINDAKVTSAFDQFIVEQADLLKTNPRSNKISPRFMQYMNAVETHDLQLATFAEKESRANVVFNKDFKQLTDQVKSIFGGNTTEVSIYDAKTNSYVKTKVTAEEFVKLYITQPVSDEPIVYGDDLAYYNMKKTDNSVLFNQSNNAAASKAYNLLKSSNIKDAGAGFNAIYNEGFSENEVMLRPINEKDPVVIAAKNNMQNATLVPADNIIISGYNKGKYMFGFKTNVDKKELPSDEELDAMGIKRAPGYTDENKKYIVSNSLFAPRTGELNYSSKEQAIASYFDGVGNATESNREKVYGSPTGLINIGNGINPVQIIKTSVYGQAPVYDIKDELTGIFINPGPLIFEQVVETMRKIEADPLFFSRMKNFKPQ